MRLLVVEDEEKLASTLKDGLEQALYTVDVAHDGEEALEYADVSHYDGIVLDVLLPRLDGLGVCRNLRARKVLTPILLLTAKDAVTDRIAGLDNGADDYLVKPFAFGELLARLRALLRRGTAGAEPLLRFAELTLDPAARAACWEDRPLGLTAREFQILETFLRRPGWVVTRNALIESVWGFDFPDSSNLIEVYVGRLRRKLGAQGAPALIQTERGAGYRLVSPACG